MIILCSLCCTAKYPATQRDGSKVLLPSRIPYPHPPCPSHATLVSIVPSHACVVFGSSYETETCSNHVFMNVVADRLPGRAIVLVSMDNLVKGASGQAIQNMNVMFDLPETEGVDMAPMFP